MSIKKILFSVCLSCLVVISYSQNNDAVINIDPPAQTVVLENSSEQDEGITSKIAGDLEKARADEKAKNKILAAAASYKKAVIAFKKGDLKKSKKHFSIFMDKLSRADIDPGLYAFLFEDKEIYKYNPKMLKQKYLRPG
ncbi:MAG: hypothetical protein LBT58_01600 [Endomicrobium sp.]|jgi:hypothetical protein|nr:hypothetical protein [Endomicrobium sp.]